MLIPLGRRAALLLAGVSIVATSAAAAPASAETVTLTPVCSAVPGSYPGATISVGGETIHVSSISNINICVYHYAITTVGTPLPQKESGCGLVCFKIDTPYEGFSFQPEIRVTFQADGVQRGIDVEPAPTSAVIGEPICVAVGTPAPDCDNAKINLSENI